MGGLGGGGEYTQFRLQFSELAHLTFVSVPYKILRWFAFTFLINDQWSSLRYVDQCAQKNLMMYTYLKKMCCTFNFPSYQGQLLIQGQVYCKLRAETTIQSSGCFELSVNFELF